MRNISLVNKRKKIKNRFMAFLLMTVISFQVFGCSSDLSEEELAEIEAYSYELMGELQEEMEDFYEDYEDYYVDYDYSNDNPGTMNSSIQNLDTWSFENSSTYFGDEGYCITKEDYNRLLSKLSFTDKDYIIYANGKKIAFHNYNYNLDGKIPSIFCRQWGGSCYGLSTWVCLTNGNTIKSSDIDNSVSLLSEIHKGENTELDKKIQSAINYYHMQQFLPAAVNIENNFMEWSQVSQLEFLENMAKQCEVNGHPISISYYWYQNFNKDGSCKTDSGAGHTVVGYGVEEGNWSSSEWDEIAWKNLTFNKKILIYDCSNPENTDRKSDLYYNDDGIWCIPYWGIISTSSQKAENKYNNGVLGLITNNISEINLIDYNTGNKSIMLDSDLNNFLLTTVSDVSYNIVTDLGTALIQGFSVVNSSFNENIPISIGSSVLPDGSVSMTDATAYLPKFNECEISTEDDELCFSLQNTEYKTTVMSNSSGKIKVGQDGTVKVNTNEKADNYVRLTTNEEISGISSYPTIEIKNEGTTELSVTSRADGIMVESDNLENLIVIGNDYTDVVELSTGSDKDSVLISSDGSSIVVSEDSDGDGDYDEIIAEEDEKTSMLEFNYDNWDDDPTGGGSGGSDKEFDTFFIVSILGGIVILITIIVIITSLSSKKNKQKNRQQSVHIQSQTGINAVSGNEPISDGQMKIDTSEEEVLIGIQFLSGSRKDEKIALRDGELAGVGKDSAQAKIVIDSSFVNVSRLHCTITYSAQFNKYFVIDASSNGTFINNGVRLQKGKRTPVERQTIISLADNQCKIRLL